MAFLSRGSEIDPQLPLEAEFRVEAGGALLGWLCVTLFSPMACLLVYAFIDHLRERYFIHDLHFNFAIAFTASSCITLILLSYAGFQRARSAHLPIILLRPGELRFCNSLAPIALTDIQVIEYSFYRDSALVTLVIRPEAALPLLAPRRFGMPYASRVWRKHRIFFQLLQPMYAGQLITKSSVILRLEHYWAVANGERRAVL